MTTILLLLAVLAQDDDAAATAALDKFKTDYKSKEATARVSAVTELASTQHEKVAARLGQLLGMDANEVRIAAAKGLGGNQVNRRKAYAMLSTGAAANAREPMVMAAILEAIGKLKEPIGAAEVERHFKSKQIPRRRRTSRPRPRSATAPRSTRSSRPSAGSKRAPRKRPPTATTTAAPAARPAWAAAARSTRRDANASACSSRSWSRHSRP